MGDTAAVAVSSVALGEYVQMACVGAPLVRSGAMKGIWSVHSLRVVTLQRAQHLVEGVPPHVWAERARRVYVRVPLDVPRAQNLGEPCVRSSTRIEITVGCAVLRARGAHVVLDDVFVRGALHIVPTFRSSHWGWERDTVHVRI
jgi:hypothetical protein